MTHTTPPKRFDGVICFGGEDWWYHNRGHYDMQMMRELSRTAPVLYINSIGMRVPRVGEGAMFAKRIARKLRSLRRGLVKVRENFFVASPLAAPAGLGAGLNRAALALQVRTFARRAGIRRPLVWIACPPAAEVVDRLRPVGVVYQRTDRFEAFHGVNQPRIAGFDRFLKQRADLTLYCSSWLKAQEGAQCRSAEFIDHGCDFAAFAEAGASGAEPGDMAPIPRPRAGFVGGIDAHTFDPPLLVETAKALPDVQFVLVGACSLPPDWVDLPNVHLLGRKAYGEVPSYMGAADVLIMPWNQSEWIQACNPVKLKEYLAVGRPVVSTPFPELDRYRGLVEIADSPGAFAAAIRRALAEPGEPAPRRCRVERETWEAKGIAALGALSARGFQPMNDPAG
ncbi:MAG TPA: glycosyltransferase [Phycisphaerales bacterium]|nr:glycosyltransferase [Phycisphaerales bacterium]